MDDLLIWSRDFNKHLEDIEAVFIRLINAGFKLKITKCEFAKSELIFLGHLITKEGIKPDPAKIEKILNWPIPSTQTEVRMFLGLASYYRRFVPGFATTAAPLHNLTKE